MDNSFCLKEAMEKRIERKRELHLLFINLEKAYDSIPLVRRNIPLVGRNIPLVTYL